MGRGRSTAGVDIGGTFTDVVVLAGDRGPRAVKVPTTAEDHSTGMVEGLTAAGAQAEVVAHGTTTATNAVLERAVARTVLVTTEGFRDLLVIGRQDRPSLYDLSIVRPEPLVPSDLVVTVRERTAADGSPVIGLTEEEISRVVAEVAALQPESVAICLLFGYAGPAHEERLATAVASALPVPVTRASALLPEFREYERASTCVLDAAVAPVMRRYLTKVRSRLPEPEVTVMTSGGGVADIGTVADSPVLTLLSGPAAGVVAAAAVARAAGFDDALAFDMGGTSTDVCLIRDCRPEVATTGTIAGLPFGTPAVAVHTVGAGGGSLAAVDAGGALRVGPASAGAVPGPACYGKGGTQPTVTDAHAVLGHLLDAQTLGDSGMHVDRPAAERALATLPGFDDVRAAAEGVVRVVEATMLRALRKVSTERGVDPARLALVGYGGAGPLHATGLARRLGCRAAVVPAVPGVLSALGLLLAPPRREVSQTVMALWDREDPPTDLGARWTTLAREVATEIPGAHVTLVADCRYEGQSHELRLEATADQDLAAVFDAAHRAAYGYALDDEPVEVVTLRAVAEGTAALEAPPSEWVHADPEHPDTARIVAGSATVSVPVVPRGALAAGDRLEGPALVVQADSTTLLAEGDRAEVLDSGSLVVRW